MKRLLAIALLVSACGGTVEPTATVMPAATLAPIVAPVPTSAGPSVMPGIVGDGSLHDAVGDLVHGPGNPVKTPAYLDIRDLEVVADGTTLRLTLTLLDELPPPALAAERLNYNISLLTDADVDPGLDGHGGGHSYTVSLSRLTPSGSYQPTLWDLPADADTRAIAYKGHEFPGTAVVAGDTIVWTVSLAALGNPHLIQLSVTSVATVTSGSADVVGSTSDHLPENGLGDWLTLGDRLDLGH